MQLNDTPRLAPGCRLHPTESVLLIPEGALNLHGPAREILQQLDGKRTVEDVVQELLKQYAGAPADDIRKDVVDLLERMQGHGVVRA
ncbi:pyrroloquinoline quinone biosynthesis peptide chaperone PqqD [Granulicella mallensis]|uniref:Coenzyme PQQ biosynthesis protein PqqD n=1 Tax=Granulicella mallensis (strain ATCC BAA-1857 / DSM 23137 / MP5ACTX8) TaxID=682795 RepID=G8P0B0_GRAMM|nr:pyrroloquinoline quinone biosynthesis peptide chaperone PqqD [Granulicella mallensis]AEU36904.1 coenzyme PQQ biosynthesis protein PqqD [Granulicella mallensis MP5ACTX8]